MNVIEMKVFHVMPDMWCKSCGQFKPYERFHSLGNGKAYTCMDCFNARQREKKRKVDA